MKSTYFFSLFLFEVVLRLNIFIFYLVRDTSWDQLKKAEAFIRQMATGSEVKSRLDGIGMGGRSSALKIMERDPTAPVEPPKVYLHLGLVGVNNWHLFFFSLSSWVMMGAAISLTNKLLLVLEEDPQGWSDHRRSCMEIAEILQLWCERVKRHRDTGAKTKRISGSSDTSGGQAV